MIRRNIISRNVSLGVRTFSPEFSPLILSMQKNLLVLDRCVVTYTFSIRISNLYNACRLNNFKNKSSFHEQIDERLEIGLMNRNATIDVNDIYH